jgi:tripartite-type tricarboxylate transporter receptor subunit TctC
VVRLPNVAEVHPSVPVNTIPELIAYAKANKLSYASAGIGTPSHLAGQLFNVMTGVNLQNVPYRGDGPAMADLIAGQIPLAFATTIASIEHIRPATSPWGNHAQALGRVAEHSQHQRIRAGL